MTEATYARLEGIAGMHRKSWSEEATRALTAVRALASLGRTDPKGLRIIRDVVAGRCSEDRIEAHLDNRHRKLLSFMVGLENERAA